MKQWLLSPHINIFFCCNTFSGERFAFSLHDERYHLPPNGHTAPLSAQVVIFSHPFRSLYSKLLLPPLERYRCSVWSKPAFRRSRSALRTVDWDNFNSVAMVGIAGQHSPSLLALSER